VNPLCLPPRRTLAWRRAGGAASAWQGVRWLRGDQLAVGMLMRQGMVGLHQLGVGVMLTKGPHLRSTYARGARH